MMFVPFVFSKSRFQGPAFRCDKIVVIVTLLEAIEGISDKDYNFWENENFHNLYERLLQERKLKNGYLEKRIYERPLHLRVNFLSTIKANIFQNYLCINLLQNVSLFTAISKTSQARVPRARVACLKFLFQRVFIPKSSAKNTRKTNSKRRNRIIFSPPDKLLKHSERKRKVVHQKDDKNKAIYILR